MVKYTLVEAFEILKQRAEWTPPEAFNTVDKFIAGVLESMNDNCMSSSENSLLSRLGYILNGKE